MKKIIIHGGIHKTGTSFIQSTLAQLRKQLEESGIHYPRLHGEDHHHQFVSRIRESEESGSQMLRKMLDNCGDADTLLLSSEEVCNDIQSAELVSRYRRIFDGQDVRFVFFLRPQYELIESVYSQIVKDFYCGPITAHIPYLMNFERRFRHLEQAFEGKVWFYPYYSGMSLWPAAQSAFGIDLDPEVPDVRVNNGMPRRKTLYLSTLRKPSNPAWRAQLVQTVAKSNAIEADGHGTLMPPAQRTHFHRSMEEANRQFFQRNGIGDAATFWKGWQIPEEPDWKPASPISIKEQHQIANEIWKHARRWD